MKKLIAVILMAALVLSIAACSPVNKTDVAILWSEGDTAVTPNSLINAMERAMYIENVAYKHYGAEGDSAKQLQQVQEALDAGSAALMVELIDTASAQSVVDLAKTKDVPVVFFGCTVDEAVVTSYDKCVAVCTDPETLATGYFDMVSEYVLENTEVKKPADDDLDLDDDGKISYITVGEIYFAQDKAIMKGKDGEPLYKKDGTYEKAVELVKLDAAFDALELVEETEKSGLFGGKTTYRHLQTADGKTVELILVADDQQAMTTLLALQELKLNATELATCFVPVFTVGADADYKAYVMASLPAEKDARKEYLESKTLIADMTALGDDDWENWEKGEKNEVDNMVFNTLNQIDTGRLTGTVMEDYDEISVTAAELVAKLVKGKAVTEPVVRIPYTTYVK